MRSAVGSGLAVLGAIAACGEPGDARHVTTGTITLVDGETEQLCWQRTHVGDIDVQGGFLEVQLDAEVVGNIRVSNRGVAWIDLRGRIEGNVLVRSSARSTRALTLRGSSTLNGDLTVEDGAQVVLEDTNVRGSVRIDGCQQLVMRDVEIEGDLEVDGCSDLDLEWVRVVGDCRGQVETTSFGCVVR